MKKEMKKTFRIQDREAGNQIDEFSTLAAAKAAIKKYEQEDKASGVYVPGFYEIAEFDLDSENWEVQEAGY